MGVNRSLNMYHEDWGETKRERHTDRQTDRQ